MSLQATRFGWRDDMWALIGAVLISSGLAAAAGPGRSAGMGVGRVSGFTVTEVDYKVDDHAEVKAVSFRVQPPATQVEIRLVDDAPFIPCEIHGARASCLIRGSLPVARVKTLQVVASDSR